MMWYSKLTGEVFEDNKVDSIVNEHIELFENEYDEFDILESIVRYEDHKITNHTLFEAIYD